ncbi:MAG: hypothetical protein R3C11_02620 [Planctomycetaceae bacterium]
MYTSRQERFLILVETSEEEPIPEEIKPFLSAPQPLERIQLLNVNAWSLTEQHVPVYPQTRFQWGIWKELHTKYPELKMQIVLEKTISRFETDRCRDIYMDAVDIDKLDAQFLLNSNPRLVQ